MACWADLLVHRPKHLGHRCHAPANSAYDEQTAARVSSRPPVQGNRQRASRPPGHRLDNESACPAQHGRHRVGAGELSARLLIRRPGVLLRRNGPLQNVLNMLMMTSSAWRSCRCCGCCTDTASSFDTDIANGLSAGWQVGLRAWPGQRERHHPEFAFVAFQSCSRSSPWP